MLHSPFAKASKPGSGSRRRSAPVWLRLVGQGQTDRLRVGRPGVPAQCRRRDVLPREVTVSRPREGMRACGMEWSRPPTARRTPGPTRSTGLTPSRAPQPPNSNQCFSTSGKRAAAFRVPDTNHAVHVPRRSRASARDHRTRRPAPPSVLSERGEAHVPPAKPQPHCKIPGAAGPNGPRPPSNPTIPTQPPQRGGAVRALR